jgi:hypothetical protein
MEIVASLRKGLGSMVGPRQAEVSDPAQNDFARAAGKIHAKNLALNIDAGGSDVFRLAGDAPERASAD